MASLLQPLGHRLFRRFFAGQALSHVGDYVFLVAIPWQVVLLGGTVGDLGAIFGTFMAGQLPMLLMGGVIVDRFPRRIVVVLADALQGMLVGGLAALALGGVLLLWHLYIFAILFGAATGLALPAMNAFLPEAVPPGTVHEANSLYQGSRSLAGIAGPAIGSLLIPLIQTGGALAFDAATFFLSALLLGTAALQGAAPEGDPRPRTSPLADMWEGLRYVRRIPWLWITILAFTVVNVAEAGPRNVVLPIFVGVELGGGPTAIGLALSAMAAGELVGLVAPSLFPRIKRRGPVAYAMTAAAGASLLLLAWVGALWHVLVLMAVRGAVLGVFSLLWSTSIMEFVDEEVRGRVVSLDMVGSFALLPAAMVGSGFLAEIVGARTVFLLGGVAIVAVAAVGLASPPAHRFEGRAGEVPVVASKTSPYDVL